MSQKKRKHKRQFALPPGTLVYNGEPSNTAIKISLIDYDETRFQQREVQSPEECAHLRYSSTVTWINVDGVHEIDIIEKFGSYFDLHPLILEDIVTTEQRPKIEDCGAYLYICLKMLSFDEKEEEIKSEQVSIILASTFIISFQENNGGDVFNPIRERIRNSKGRIRKMGNDYLAYCLIDAIVDNYFIILEKLGEKIENLEEGLVSDPKIDILENLYKLKRDMLFIRKAGWPVREIVNILARRESRLIQKTTAIYLRDVYDHIVQIMDTLEIFRDMLAGMIDIYLSSLSRKMNEVMKVLTIITTIFIPLSLIPTIYGMNFRYMPGLESPWGFTVVLLIMAGLGVAMMVYFKRKKWI